MLMLELKSNNAGWRNCTVFTIRVLLKSILTCEMANFNISENLYLV